MVIWELWNRLTSAIKLRSEIGLFIMPGLAFDYDFHRIGYGGGFYDRYLSEDNTFIKAALAFDFQLLESIPYEEHDLNRIYYYTDTVYKEGELMESLEQIGIKAKKASRYLAKLGIDEKNKALKRLLMHLQLMQRV